MPNIPAHIHESIEAISLLHAQSEKGLTAHQRRIERVANVLGRPSFIVIMLVLVALWIGANVVEACLGHPQFDPFPYFCLQGIVSFCALVITSVVLTTGRRQLLFVEKRSQLDLQINLLTERKIAKVIALIEELRRDLPNVQDRTDPEARAMQIRMDPQAVADAMEQFIAVEVDEPGNGEEPKGEKPQ